MSVGTHEGRVILIDCANDHFAPERRSARNVRRRISELISGEEGYLVGLVGMVSWKLLGRFDERLSGVRDVLEVKYIGVRMLFSVRDPSFADAYDTYAGSGRPMLLLLRVRFGSSRSRGGRSIVMGSYNGIVVGGRVDLFRPKNIQADWQMHLIDCLVAFAYMVPEINTF